MILVSSNSNIIHFWSFSYGPLNKPHNFGKHIFRTLFTQVAYRMCGSNNDQLQVIDIVHFDLMSPTGMNSMHRKESNKTKLSLIYFIYNAL